MTTKLIHTKKSFASEAAGSRRALRAIEIAIRSDDWREAEILFMEMSGIAGTMEARCRDNIYNQLDYDCDWRNNDAQRAVVQ